MSKGSERPSKRKKKKPQDWRRKQKQKQKQKLRKTLLTKKSSRKMI